jgi:hypothetical protein
VEAISWVRVRSLGIVRNFRRTFVSQPIDWTHEDVASVWSHEHCDFERFTWEGLMAVEPTSMLGSSDVARAHA